MFASDLYLELVEKTELLRRLSVYAMIKSKIHLDRYGSFRKILLILSWDENLNPGPVHGIQNEYLLHLRNVAFAILVLSTKKSYSHFLKKGLRFSENWFQI